MKTVVKTRKPGRPPGPGSGLSREKILARAGKLLDARGLKAFSMRGLAAAMKADPMTVYHYFPNREALLTELAVRHFSEFRFARGRRVNRRGAALALARAYLEHIRDRLELLLFLTRVPEAAAEPARIMGTYFADIVASPDLKGARLNTANHVFFDFLHGYALGLRGGAGTGAAFKKELDVVLDGIDSLRIASRR